MAKVTGKVAQIIGPVIDVEFSSDSKLPQIYDSLEITRKDGSLLVLEVEQHIGEDTVRCIAMDSTDGLSRGYEVVATVIRYKCLLVIIYTDDYLMLQVMRLTV